MASGIGQINIKTGSSIRKSALTAGAFLLDLLFPLACLGCDAVPSLDSGTAQRETTPDGRPGIRVTWRLMRVPSRRGTC
jgi:hypothetical protein